MRPLLGLVLFVWILALGASTSDVVAYDVEDGGVGRVLYGSPTTKPTYSGPYSNDTMCHMKSNVNSCASCVMNGCVYCTAKGGSCYSTSPSLGYSCNGGTTYQGSGLSTSTAKSLCDGTLAKSVVLIAILSSVIPLLCCCAIAGGCFYYFRQQQLKQAGRQYASSGGAVTQNPVIVSGQPVYPTSYPVGQIQQQGHYPYPPHSQPYPPAQPYPPQQQPGYSPGVYPTTYCVAVPAQPYAYPPQQYPAPSSPEHHYPAASSPPAPQYVIADHIPAQGQAADFNFGESISR